MAKYSFICTRCDLVFDKEIHINKPKKSKCTKCRKSDKVKRYYNDIPVIFIGSGFYRTDNKK